MAGAVRPGSNQDAKAMNRTLAVFLVGFLTLGSGVQKASAWWLWDTLFHHDCPRTRCTQYNAFSPFCCEGYSPMPGYGHGGTLASSFSDGQGYLGELPAPGVAAGPVMGTPTFARENIGAAPDAVFTVPGNNAQVVQPGVPVRQWPGWRPGMMNPPPAPGFYPGFINYGPANVPSSPSYPGFPAYGPANGFGR